MVAFIMLPGISPGRPVLSSPLTTMTTPIVNESTVELFIRLTPIVRRIEIDEQRQIEIVHRAHQYRRAKRLSYHLNVISDRLRYDTGTDIWQYIDLKREIFKVLQVVAVVRQLRREKSDLIDLWERKIADDTAADEIFVNAKERINEDIACQLKQFEQFPPEARAAVDRNYERILVAFEPPLRITRHEARELYERDGEALPPPPFNPYRDPFFPPDYILNNQLVIRQSRK